MGREKVDLGYILVNLVLHPQNLLIELLHQNKHILMFCLEPVCKIRKEENGSDGNHGGEVGSSFFVARGNPTKLLEAIDEAFHDISFAIVRFVERTSATFGTATSNGATNVITMKVSSKRLTGIAFIGHQTLGAEAQLT